MRKKNKRTIKKIVTCDIKTVQCNDRIVKCDVLVTWYNMLPTSEYRTQKKKGTIELLKPPVRKEIKETIKVVTSKTYINVVRR